MRAFGVIVGIIMSILGGYAFVMPMDEFLKLGWLLGVVFVLSGALLLIPKCKEIKFACGKREEKSPFVKKVKKDHTNSILGGISVVIGLILLISGLTRTITNLGVVYLVGACVMFYGIIQLSVLTKKSQEESKKPIKKKQKKSKATDKKKGINKTKIVCCVISLLIGGLAIYSSFISFVTVDELIAYNIVLQGINVVVITLEVYKKGERI